MRNKKMMVAGVILCILCMFGFLVSLQPGEFVIQRTATMAAPPAAVHAQLNDFKNWEAWSPWMKLDPNMTKTYEGAPAGEGAVFKWSGNDDAGEGAMQIVESKPAEGVKIKLDFKRPMESTADVHIAVKPKDAQSSEVTWSMSGKRGFMEKLFCMFVDVDKMVGTDFEKGLNSIKEIVEKKPAS